MFAPRASIFWNEHPLGDYRVGTTYCLSSPLIDYFPERFHGHTFLYGRCMNCRREYAECWETNVAKLRGVLGAKSEATWADQVDKESISRVPFWIHNVKATSYDDPDGRPVSLLVLDITLNGSSRRDPRAVITLGRTEEREPLLEAFQSGSVTEPIGPCITYSVGLKKGGQTFWRMEDAPDSDDEPVMFAAANGKGRGK